MKGNFPDHACLNSGSANGKAGGRLIQYVHAEKHNAVWILQKHDFSTIRTGKTWCASNKTSAMRKSQFQVLSGNHVASQTKSKDCHNNLYFSPHSAFS